MNRIDLLKDLNNMKWPDPVCMQCSKDCDTWEVVEPVSSKFDLWAYCLDCDCETFHPINYKD